MRRAALAAMMLVLAASCGGGAESRTLFIDYSSDEFASFFLFNFPRRIEVHPGTTLVFRQTWTGEPHTVTGGKLVTSKLRTGAHWVDFFESFDALRAGGTPLPNPEDPGNATVADLARAVKTAKPANLRRTLIGAWNALRAQGAKLPDLDAPGSGSFADLVRYVGEEADKAFSGLPLAFDEGSGDVAQNAGQPCYLERGGPPKRPQRACPKARQRQPVFDGTQTYYNSGIIPYEGQQGNTYRVPLAEDLKPGNYWFFCSVHGFGQRTEVVVRPKSERVPTQGQVTMEARKEIDAYAKPLERQWRDAADGTFTIPGPEKTTVKGPFAGLMGAEHTAINEFVPRRLTVKAGKPITWKMMGSDHTIAFNPPKYFPPVQFLKSGKIRFNPRLRPAAGGAKPVPEQHGRGILEHDGGTFDGTGFWSSGLIGAEPYLAYTLRVSKPGTYKFACLIHPPMVGTLVVRA